MERTFMSNTVDSKRSVEVTHEDCLQQTFSTDVGIALQFPQTHQGTLPAGWWGISGGSLCRAARTSSRPPRVLKVLNMTVRHCSKSKVDKNSYKIPRHHTWEVITGWITCNCWALVILWLGITGFSSLVTCINKIAVALFTKNQHASYFILAAIPSCSTPAVAATMHASALTRAALFPLAGTLTSTLKWLDFLKH